MKEVKTPKKPLAYYYGIVLIVLIVFNLVVTPILMEHQVKETDYGTFMSMIEKKNIGEVEVNDNQIIFTDKDQKNIYKTGLMNSKTSRGWRILWSILFLKAPGSAGRGIF